MNVAAARPSCTLDLGNAALLARLGLMAELHAATNGSAAFSNHCPEE